MQLFSIGSWSDHEELPPPRSQITSVGAYEIGAPQTTEAERLRQAKIARDQAITKAVGFGLFAAIMGYTVITLRKPTKWGAQMLARTKELQEKGKRFDKKIAERKYNQ